MSEARRSGRIKPNAAKAMAVSQEKVVGRSCVVTLKAKMAISSKLGRSLFRFAKDKTSPRERRDKRTFDQARRNDL